MRKYDVDATGKVVKQVGGRGFYAEVSVSIDGGDSPNADAALAPSANDKWQQREGWLEGALRGALIGLKLANAPRRCTLTRIHGMICDTSPTVVAIAAIRAVWSALDFVPDQETSNRIDDCILKSHSLKVEELESALRA